MSNQETFRTPSVKPMRETFLRGLSFYASIAFLASLLISIALEDHSCRLEIQQEIEAKIAENNEYLSHLTKTSQTVQTLAKKDFTAEIRTLAHILDKTPEMFYTSVPGNNSEMEEIASLLQFDEIYVLSSDGDIDASWPNSFVGINIESDERFSELLPVFNAPIPRTAPNVLLPVSYADDEKKIVVSTERLDKDGVIIARTNSGKTRENLEDLAPSHSLNATVGRTGSLRLFRSEYNVYSDQLLDICNTGDIPDFPKIESIPLGKTSLRFFNNSLNFIYAKKTPLGTFVGWLPQNEMFMSKFSELAMISFCNFIVFLAIFVLVSLFVQKLFVDSVYEVNRSLRQITAGNLEEKVNVKASKEFVALSTGVNTTVSALKRAAAEVKRRTEEELILASKIQAASLPKVSEIVNRNDSLDADAQHLPTSGVSGDMYDLFFTDDQHVVFYVADVSGSGVAASLVMMKTMALVKNLAFLGHELSTIVTLANHYLSDSSDSAFVSGFFCSLDVHTGTLEYVDAGHIPPLLRKRGKTFQLFNPQKNLLLGVNPDLVYQSETITLNPGDSLLMYTDGILGTKKLTLHELLESGRFTETLNELPADAPAHEHVSQFMHNVRRLSSQDRPTDDVVVLCLRYLATQQQAEPDNHAH